MKDFLLVCYKALGKSKTKPILPKIHSSIQEATFAQELSFQIDGDL